ncbi:hypothetical protein FAI40_01175 [Acetobacteraceae bacterium]|nr:hypothetical protein FAI40_01175 [Acetobacteraceae bacterium]
MTERPLPNSEILPELSKLEFSSFIKAREQPPKWGLLDFIWRRERYGRTIPQKRGRDRLFWQKKGWETKQSPNAFFDPAFYVENCSLERRPSSLEEVIELYLKNGLSGHAPHWLFSEKEYFFFNPELSEKRFCFDVGQFIRRIRTEPELFLNYYDHFVLKGDLEKKRPHRFFVPKLFLEELEKLSPKRELPEGMGAWQFFLSCFELQITTLRTSWHFDPVYYLEKYPEVAEEIAKKKFSSPLHHYLTNKTPLAFDPCKYFSETEYLRHHPDVREAIEAGNFRNGYDHFLRCGQEEGRTFLTDKNFYPRNIFHFLQKTPEVEAEMKRLGADDLFSLYVAYHELGKDLKTLYAPAEEKETQSKETLKDFGQIMRLSQARQEALFSVLSRSPLQVFSESWDEDFFTAKPYLSVVLFSHGDYTALISSIESLAPILKQGTELLIVSSGNLEEQRTVERLVKGEYRFCHLLKLEDVLAFWKTALQTLRAENTLWMAAGVRLEGINLSRMLAVLEKGDAAAFGARVIQGLKENHGGSLSYDGTLNSFREVSEQEKYSFFEGEKEIDVPPSGIFLFQVSSVREIWKKIQEAQQVKERLIWTSFSDFETVALSLRESGKKIRFSPTFYAVVSEKLSFSKGEMSLARWRRKNFADLLLAERPEKLSFVLPKLPDNSSSEGDKILLEEVQFFSNLGFELNLLAFDKNEADFFKRLCSFGTKIDWEEASQNWQNSLFERLEKSDLTWIVGLESLQKFLTGWQNYQTESSLLSPCVVDLRFEKDLSELSLPLLDAIEKNPLIEGIILVEEGKCPLLDKKPELRQIILSSKSTRSEKQQKLRMIFMQLRQVFEMQGEVVLEDLEFSQKDHFPPKRPLKLIGD